MAPQIRIADMHYNKYIIYEAKVNNKIVYRKQQPTEELENIIYNADFRFGTDGFRRFGNATIQEISDGWLIWIKQLISNSNTYTLSTFTKKLIPEHIYYGRCEFNVVEEGKYFNGQIQLNAPNIYYNSKTIQATESNIAQVSGIFHVTEQYRLFLNMNSGTENLETLFRLRNPMFIDVTELINSGLTEEQVKEKLDNTAFFPDKTPPSYIKIQVFNKNNPSYIGVNSTGTVRISATFNTNLSMLPTLTIGNQSTIMTETSDGKGGVIYQADITLSPNNIMTEGKLQFTISGYADRNGNVGEVITQENASNSLIYDNTPPVITIKTGIDETVGDIDTNTFSKVSFKLYDNMGIQEYELNGQIGRLSVSQWSDINNITTNFKGALIGDNILIVRDIAGNEATYEFKLVES
jgi:hypothetical protein